MIESISEQVTKHPEFPPLMAWAHFADWVRVEHGVFQAWMDRGYIPTVKVGKHRLVNVVLLVDQLREQGQ